MIALALLITMAGAAGFGIGVWLMSDTKIDRHPAMDRSTGKVVDRGRIVVRR